MKYAIFVLTHYNKEFVIPHYKWHEQICDTYIIYQTSKIIDFNNFILVDIPGTMCIWNVTRLLAHYAIRYDYDYYVLMAGDCFILRKDWIPKTIEFMKEKEADVSFTHISAKCEHFKVQFYKMIEHFYKIDRKEIKWSLNACNVFSRKALEIYNKTNYFKVYDEVDPYNALAKKVKVVGNPFINYNAFSASCLTDHTVEEIKAKIYRPYKFDDPDMVYETNESPKDLHIIHAVKDFDKFRQLGFKL